MGVLFLNRSQRVSLIVVLAVFCAALLALMPGAYGQTAASSATFAGFVEDPSGARVADATVTISNTEKGIKRSFKSDAEGNFSFALLPAGTYTLTVEAKGFKTFKQENITLEVGQSATQTIALSIGQSDQIEVNSEAPLFTTDNANLAAEVSTKQVTELPLNLRNVFNFVQLNSSVNNSQRQLIETGDSQGSADQDVSFFNFGGGYGVFFPRQYPGVPIIPGFAADTPYVATTNGVGPCAGCSLRNAFTSGLVPVVGKSLGGLTNVAFDVTAVSPSRKAYYTQQWSYRLQYAPSPKDLLELSYVGNHSVHVVTSGFNLNQLPTKYFSMGTALNTLVANPFFGHVAASGCGLEQPTVRQGQLLRPHPEFCNINENLIPGGDGRYNALDFSFTHRVSNSLTLMASYTFSKFLDNIGGPTTWANTSGAFSENIRDVYNLAAKKSVDPNDVAHGFVLSYVYELPVGQGRKYGNGMTPVLNAEAGGWQTSGIVALKGGFPLRINGPNTGLGGFGVGQNVNIIGNYHVANQIRTQWFNTAAFAQPTQITDLGNAPRCLSDLRSPGYKNIERLVIAT